MDKNQLVTLIAALIGLFAVLVARSLPEGHRAYRIGAIVTMIGLIICVAMWFGRNSLLGKSPSQAPTRESLQAPRQGYLATLTPAVDTSTLVPAMTPRPYSTPNQAQQMIIPGTEPAQQVIMPGTELEQQVIMPGPDSQQVVTTPLPGQEGAS